MSRIAIWSPNYAPELTGIPPLVTDAAEWLAARGHEVTVVTAFPNYPSRRIDPAYSGALWRVEQQNGVRVERSWLRVRPRETFADKVLYEASFAVVSLPLAVRAAARADVLVCVVPSLAAASFASVVKRVRPRLRLVLWFQDLVLAGAAALQPSRLAGRALDAARRAERFAARAADAVVVCSPGFGDHLARLGVEPAKIDTVYNWVDTEWIGPADDPPRAVGRTRFLYAGNIGYSQGLETLVEAARRTAADCDVTIVGDGNAVDALRAAAGAVQSVSLQPPVPRADYPRLLAGSDVHVVVQRRVSAGANLPSKIASYLASGRPLLASIDDATAAAELLRESEAAVLVEPDDAEALAAGMRLLHADPARRAELGRRGRAFAVSRLGREPALSRLEQRLLGGSAP